MDIGGFLSAYLSDWVGFMSGPISIVLTAFGFLRKSPDTKKAFLFAGAGIAFLVAPVHIWTIEHQARMAAQTKLDEHMPDLRLRIEEFATGTVNEKTVAIATVTLRNLGTPSIADSWALKLDTPFGHTCRFENNVVPSDGFTMLGQKRFQGEDALYNRVSTDPIPQGGKKIGILYFILRGCEISPEDLHSASPGNLKLYAKDVNGKLIESVPFLPDTTDGSIYRPGLSLPRKVDKQK